MLNFRKQRIFKGQARGQMDTPQLIAYSATPVRRLSVTVSFPPSATLSDKWTVAVYTMMSRWVLLDKFEASRGITEADNITIYDLPAAKVEVTQVAGVSPKALDFYVAIE